MARASSKKLKMRILDGPQIRQFINDHHFVDSINETERKAWDSFVLIVKNFLGNHKADNYVDLVNSMFNNFRDLGCSISIKVHYLHSHLDCFFENLGNTSEK